MGMPMECITRRVSSIELIYKPFTKVLRANDENIDFCERAVLSAKRGKRPLVEVIYTIDRYGRRHVAAYEGATKASWKARKRQTLLINQGLTPVAVPEWITIQALAPEYDGNSWCKITSQTLELMPVAIHCRSCGRKVYRTLNHMEFEQVGKSWVFMGTLGDRYNRHSHCCHKCLPYLRAALANAEAVREEKNKWGHPHDATVGGKTHA